MINERYTRLERIGEGGTAIVYRAHDTRLDCTFAVKMPRDALTTTGWVPVEFATKVYGVAAPLLYPNQTRPLRLLGRDLAKDNFKGVFRFVLRVVSAETLMEKTSTLWRSFHDHGQATLTREGPQFVRFEVRGYPSMPEPMRESITGWLAQAVELTGAIEVRVMRANGNEDGWGWTIHWR